MGLTIGKLACYAEDRFRAAPEGSREKTKYAYTVDFLLTCVELRDAGIPLTPQQLRGVAKLIPRLRMPEDTRWIPGIPDNL